jgi:hypothetical protein
MGTAQQLKAFLLAHPAAVRTAFFWIDTADRTYHAVVLAKPAGALGEWAEFVADTAPKVVTASVLIGLDLGTALQVSDACWRMRPGAQ